jgi:hypothetical protein
MLGILPLAFVVAWALCGVVLLPLGFWIVARMAPWVCQADDDRAGVVHDSLLTDSFDEAHVA